MFTAPFQSKLLTTRDRKVLRRALKHEAKPWKDDAVNAPLTHQVLHYKSLALVINNIDKGHTWHWLFSISSLFAILSLFDGGALRGNDVLFNFKR